MDLTFKDPQEAFKHALMTNRLSGNPKAPNYVGNYMYMGTENGIDLFKHIITRQYLRSVP